MGLCLTARGMGVGLGLIALVQVGRQARPSFSTCRKSEEKEMLACKPAL